MKPLSEQSEKELELTLQSCRRHEIEFIRRGMESTPKYKSFTEEVSAIEAALAAKRGK